MKANRIDNIIQKKLAQRTFKPSASAWERLSVNLEEHPKQNKRGWFLYAGIAASIAILMNVTFLMFNESKPIEPEETVVEKPIKTKVIDTKLNQIKKEQPTKVMIATAAELTEKKEVIKISSSRKKLNFDKTKKELSDFKIQKEKQIVMTQNEFKDEVFKEKLELDKTAKKNKNILSRDLNNSIEINSEDLLFAVTHSAEEVENYYAKYDFNREDVLKIIQNELIKTNIKIDPETILAEVERTIDDDIFQNNFMNSLQKRVSDIAVAIASRNN